MDPTNQARLLNALHTRISDLPSVFTSWGITSQQDITELVNSLKQQIHQIAMSSYDNDEIQKNKIKSLQLEVDFVKNLYINNNTKLKDCSKYKNLYNDTLKKLKRITAEYNELQSKPTTNDQIKVLKTKIQRYESDIERMTNELQLERNVIRTLDEGDVAEIKTLEFYLKNILKLIYPDDDDADINSINYKLVNYIQNSIGQTNIINNLNSTIKELNSRNVQKNKEHHEKIKNLVERCNSKLRDAEALIVTNNERDINFPKELETDLLYILTSTLNKNGTWDNKLLDLSTADTVDDDSEYETEEEFMDASAPPERSSSPYEDMEIPSTPGKNLHENDEPSTNAKKTKFN